MVKSDLSCVKWKGLWTTAAKYPERCLFLRVGVPKKIYG